MKLKGKRILVGTELFYPLFGGGEKALIDWLMEFHNEGADITVLTIAPELEGYEKEFPFEVIRLLPKQKLPLNSKDIWQYYRDIGIIDTDYLPHFKKGLLLNIAKQTLETLPPFDIYLGYGAWGFHNIKNTLCNIVKDISPQTMTFGIFYDVYNLKSKVTFPDIDYLISCAPIPSIKNKYFYNEPLVLLPNQLTFDRDFIISLEEWRERPYDFVFNNPILHKGVDIVKALIREFPQKKFLIKKGGYFSISEENQKFFDGCKNVTLLETDISMEKDFFRKGKFLLYPSFNEGFGLMPIEALSQNTIPICSDIDILKFSGGSYMNLIQTTSIQSRAKREFFGWVEPIEGEDLESIIKDWISGVKNICEDVELHQTQLNESETALFFMKIRYEGYLDNFYRLVNSFK